MTKLRLPAAALALAVLAVPAFASNGGDRTAAGGAFMSSYSNGAYASRSQQPAPYDRPFVSGRDDVGATGSIAPRRFDRRR